MASAGYQRLSEKDVESAAKGGKRDLSAYLQDVDAIQKTIQDLNNSISQLESLYVHAQELTGAELEENTQKAEILASQVQDGCSVIRNRLAALDIECKRFPPESSERTQRRNQWSLLTDKFMKTLQRNLQVQDVGRKDTKTKVERQFRIANPNATADEIQTVLDGERGDIFTSQLLASERSSQAQSVLREVKDRQKELQRIEKSASELAALFQDMQTLVARQNEVIEEVVKNTEEIQVVIEQANKELDVAVGTARSARSKRQILLIILFIVFIIIICAIILANRKK